jgi:hypothetical protein
MTQIMIDVPKTKEKEYKKIFNMFVMSYTIDELREIENVKIDLQNHNLEDLSKNNVIAYKNSFNIKEENLINI